MNITKTLQGVALAGALGSSIALEAKTTVEKPNIVFIMVDQMRFDMISAMGNKNINTPNLDALINQSITFENAYTPAPTCAPARASIFSGMSSKRSGGNINWYPMNGKVVVFPTHLRNANYNTASVGKLHLVPHINRWGFDYKKLLDAPYNVYAGHDEYSDYQTDLEEKYGKEKADKIQRMYNEDELAYSTNLEQFLVGRDIVEEEDHMTTWTTDKSIDFLKEREKDRPFMLYVGYFGPHHPWGVPEGRKKTDPKSLDMPELDFDYSDKPIIKMGQTKTIKHNRELFDKADYQRIMALYYDNVMMIDDNIGRLFAELKAQGVWDNTMVVFTADHGEHGGHFGLFFKGTMLESSAKVPLIIKFPEQKNPKRVETAVSNLDVYGTFMEIAGIKNWHHKYMDTGSLNNYYDSKYTMKSSPAFSHIGNTSMLREGDFKLVMFHKKGEEPMYEFYKLAPNSFDDKNIYGSKEYEKIQEDLKVKLHKLVKDADEVKIPDNLWRKYNPWS